MDDATCSYCRARDGEPCEPRSLEPGCTAEICRCVNVDAVLSDAKGT